MARVFVTRRLTGDALDRLRQEHDVEVWEGELPPAPQELYEHVAPAEGLLSLLTLRTSLADTVVMPERDFSRGEVVQIAISVAGLLLSAATIGWAVSH